jgi:hypothetical protein
MLDDDVDRLMRHVEAKIDLARAAKGKSSYWASLPLCIVDSVFSIRAKYTGVVRVVNRWCESQEPCWVREISFKPTNDIGPTVRDFVDILDRRLKDGSTYENLFRNRARTSSRSGILKAKAVHLFASALLDSGINTFGDLRDRSKLEAAETGLRKIPGQRTGYFLMLAGEDDYVKPDTHLRRFVNDALCIDWKHLASEKRAEELVREAARRFAKDYGGLTAAGLDYAIWSYQHTQTRPSQSCI